MNRNGHYGWREGARIVPSYALTEGRTRPAGESLPLEALMTVTDLAQLYEATLQRESRAILALCQRPTSVAEVGAALRLPIGVARVLVSDLVASGCLYLAQPIPVDVNGRPSREILERLLDGLRAC